jgi:hypothetical protein
MFIPMLQHQSHVMWSGRKQMREEEAQKHRTCSDAKCSIVEHWFSVNMNCSVNVLEKRKLDLVTNSSEKRYNNIISSVHKVSVKLLTVQ